MTKITLIKGTRSPDGYADYEVNGERVTARDQIEAIERISARKYEALRLAAAEKTECLRLIAEAIAAGGRIVVTPEFPPIRLVDAVAEIGWLAQTHTSGHALWFFVARDEKALDAHKGAVDRAAAQAEAPSAEDERGLFCEAGEALWGERWQTEAAGALRLSDRTVRRFVAGTHPLPEGVARELATLCGQRRDRLMGLQLRLAIAADKS